MMRTIKKTQLVKALVQDLQYEDKDVQEILYAKKLVEIDVREENAARQRRLEQRAYFRQSGCIAHNRVSCIECMRSATVGTSKEYY